MSRLTIALLCLFVSFAYTQFQCSVPCISTNTCITSSCNTQLGVCVETVNTQRAECCEVDSECNDEIYCYHPKCNTAQNTCEYIPICELPPPGAACQTDKQCQDSSNTCATSKCIDGFCHSSPLIDTNSPHCCSSTADCPDVECSVKYCNVETFHCFYEDIKGCEPMTTASTVYVAEESYVSPPTVVDHPTPKEKAFYIIISVMTGIFIIFAVLALFDSQIKKGFRNIKNQIRR